MISPASEQHLAAIAAQIIGNGTKQGAGMERSLSAALK
jgi:hypothetical protein